MTKTPSLALTRSHHHWSQRSANISNLKSIKSPRVYTKTDHCSFATILILLYALLFSFSADHIPISYFPNHYITTINNPKCQISVMPTLTAALVKSVVLLLSTFTLYLSLYSIYDLSKTFSSDKSNNMSSTIFTSNTLPTDERLMATIGNGFDSVRICERCL